MNLTEKELDIIVRKGCVFLLEPDKDKHELIDKTTKYLNVEIDGGDVSQEQWDELYKNLALARARARALALDLDLALAVTVTVAVTVAQALARARARALALDLDLALAQARALDLDQALARARALALALVDFLITELGDFVPKIEGIDKRIYADITDGGFDLNMLQWHTCKTTHCRAGFAELYAGDKGKLMVKKFGNWLTGAIIYKKNEGYIPDFYASDKDAFEDIKSRALA